MCHHTHAHTHTDRNMCALTHTQTHMHAHVHRSCTHVCRHTHSCSQRCMCVCAHIYMHRHELVHTHTSRPGKGQTCSLEAGCASNQVSCHRNQGTSVLLTPDSLVLSHSLWDKGTACAEDAHRGWMETVPESPP